VAYTDFHLLSLEELTVLRGEAIAARSEMIRGRRGVKFVVDGNVVSYSPIELPQLNKLISDVLHAIEQKNSESAGITCLVVHGHKGL
jgi:hypothetical protein